MEICFDLLSSYFEPGSEIDRVNRIYELFTTRDLMRKAEILLQIAPGEFAASKAWTDLVNGENDITLLAYTALQVEARRRLPTVTTLSTPGGCKMRPRKTMLFKFRCRALFHLRSSLLASLPGSGRRGGALCRRSRTGILPCLPSHHPRNGHSGSNSPRSKAALDPRHCALQ